MACCRWPAVDGLLSMVTIWRVRAVLTNWWLSVLVTCSWRVALGALCRRGLQVPRQAVDAGSLAHG